jgi:muconolactone delta-isomerase
MLFHLSMTIRIPHNLPLDTVKQLTAHEHKRAGELEHQGKWRHAWRVVGKWANVSLSRMDSAWLDSINVAVKKTKTSVLFEMETQTVWQFSNLDGPAHGIESTNGGIITFAGGIPLKSVEGKLLGAIGVSGGMVEQDYEIAQSGAAVLVVQLESAPSGNV